MSKTREFEPKKDENLRIAYICINYPPAIGGIASVLSATAQELVNRGQEVHVITPKLQDVPTYESKGNLSIHRIPMRDFGAFSKLGFILKAVYRFYKIRPSLIHSHDIFLPTTAASVYNLLTNTPIILTIHTSSSGLGLGDVAVLKQSHFGSFRQNWLSKNIAFFIALSQIIREDLKTLGISESKIVPIPNGIDVERFFPASGTEQMTLRQQLELPNGIIVIYAGRLHSDKRVDQLIKIWKNIRIVHPNATLLIVGSGPDEDLLRKSAGPGIIFTGGIQNVAPYLRSADLFVLPSVSEGFSLSILEALACGLPVIVTPVGAVNEVINHGQNGWIVDIDNLACLEASILELIGDPGLRTALGNAGRQSVEDNYAISSVISKLIDLYKLALIGKARK